MHDDVGVSSQGLEVRVGVQDRRAVPGGDGATPPAAAQGDLFTLAD